MDTPLSCDVPAHYSYKVYSVQFPCLTVIKQSRTEPDCAGTCLTSVQFVRPSRLQNPTICIYHKVEISVAVNNYNYIVALSIRKADLRVDEVQGVISQVDLSGGSMKR